jgi:hypothetical protein
VKKFPIISGRGEILFVDAVIEAATKLQKVRATDRRRWLAARV